MIGQTFSPRPQDFVPIYHVRTAHTLFGSDVNQWLADVLNQPHPERIEVSSTDRLVVIYLFPYHVPMGQNVMYAGLLIQGSTITPVIVDEIELDLFWQFDSSQ